MTPIGGLPEKLMAAQRAGIQKVFIPKDNVDDLKDVADEVKARLTVIPVGTMQEILKKTGESRSDFEICKGICKR